ncbi:MAG TPA: SusC/RagA family TonB-linked outer membrane protein [Gemmatimonadaceae bacterium]|nr:SusC/RagA family TonB-linked outer membrane protein [Gemmatimonadaceae bacterium]
MRVPRIGLMAGVYLAASLPPTVSAGAQGFTPLAQVASATKTGARVTGSLLDRAANLDAESEPLRDVLVRLRRTSGVFVAFSPTRVPATVRVTCRCAKVTVGDALAQLLRGLPFTYSEMGELVTVEPVGSELETNFSRSAAQAAHSDGQSEPVNEERRGASVVGISKGSRSVVAAVVSGRVSEEGSGRPLTSAQVSIEGTRLGAITGDDGRYRIVGVPAGSQKINVRLIGYAAQQTTVAAPDDGDLEVNFVLVRQAISLSQVLVTGTAGRQEMRAQGATVASVNVGRVTELTPVKSVTDIISGRVAGVSVTQGSGVSGSSQQIRIRGASSISLSNEPLVYVDGIRIDTKQTAVAAGAVVNPLNDMDPNEIESVEIVKGPAAATLYGADASAGVIQIITKRGAAGTPFRKTLSVTHAQLDPTFTPYTNFAACRAQDLTTATLCKGRSVGDVVSDQPMVRYGLPNTGHQTSINGSVRGGGTSYGFFSSIGVDQEKGLFPNNTYDRMSARLNYNIQPTEKTRIELNLPALRVTGDLPVTAGSSAGWTTGGMAGSPLTVGTPTDGWFGANRTPDAIASIRHEINSVRLIPDVKLSWNPSAHFRNRLTLGADLSSVKSNEFFPKNSNGWYSASQNLGIIREDRRDLQRGTANYLGTLDLAMGRGWNSTLSFGSEVQADVEDLTYALGNQLTTNSARSVSAAAQVSGGQTVVRDRRVGFYGQWEPNYDERVYLQFGLRADRFAAFGASAPWFYSPSARVSYVLSDEPFFSVDWIKSLRLRAAFGTTGRAPTAGASLRTFLAAPYLTGPNQVASGIIPLNPGNPKLQAERGQEFETGIDASLFNERLGLELTFFDKNTKNLLLRVPQPPSLGFQEDGYRNIGKVLNRGLELTARTKVITGENFSWGVDVGANTLRNEILDLGGVPAFSSIRFGTVNSVRQGRQVGAFYTNRIQRIDADAGVAVVSDSLEYVGNLLPTFEANAASTFTFFRKLRLYTQFDTKRNFYIYNATAAYRERNFGVAENAVRRNEVLTAEQRLSRFGPYVTASGASMGTGTVLGPYLERADFVRLNEVTLSYQLPDRIARKAMGAHSASLALSGRNVALWSPYSGFNPDVQNEMDALAGRADFFTLPPPRRLGVRLDLTF